MCGIAGMSGRDASRGAVQAMVRSLRHRGPDGEGLYEDRTTVLGHARLAIIDPEGGHQPMSSPDGRVWLVCNGEIYNFRELREELESAGARFRTRSDNEVLVHGYQAWGLGLLRRLDGMFAFALWDGAARKLVLARDLFGIKPLHYHFDGRTFRFASEIKAILQDRRVPREVDMQALHWFMNLRFIPGERTLFKNVRRLAPGTALVFQDGKLRTERYAELQAETRAARLPEAEYAEGVRHYLKQAVRKQRVSDVPLGAYLSGGLDSSSIVALLSDVTEQSLPTFCLGFGEPTDELADARVVADRFGTDHHEETISPDPLADFPRVIWATEEPKENILQGYLLARMARRHVKVVLGGLGGDELFAGYQIHRFMYPSDRAHRMASGALTRRVLGSASRWLYRAQTAVTPLRFDEYRRGAQLLLASGDPCLYYSILRNVWDHDPGARSSLYGPAWRDVELTPTRETFAGYFAAKEQHVAERALRAELHTKMVDDFLLNEDRTSMAWGLEVRVPFLDMDLVRFAQSIPIDLQLKHNRSKHVFRQAMAGILPRQTLRKKKWGFTFDPHHQFRKDLRRVAAQLLTRQRVEARGWFNYTYLRRIIDHPPHPRLRWHYFFLWLVVGLEIWSRMFLEGDLEQPEFDLEAYL